MNEEQLEYFMNHPGFVAALDQSGGSTPKTLEAYGIDNSQYNDDQEMLDLVHAMRSRIICSKCFGSNHLVGTILFQDTAGRMIGDKPSADYLWERKHIVPFIKIDKGLEEKSDGVQLMKSMDQVEALLDFSKDHHALGTKERSVIFDNNPTGIRNIVDQQFDLAEKAIAKGLLPILEPEVNIGSTEKAAAEKTLLDELESHIVLLGERSPIAIKITLPEQDNLYRPLMRFGNVVKILALSGGYKRAEACDKLKHNQHMIASFCRALLEGLRAEQSDVEFDSILARNIEMIYRASVNKVH